MAPAMPCKRPPSIVKTSAKLKIGNEKEFKTMYGCVVESHASARQRAESVESKNHEDHIAVEGLPSMTQDNSVHKFIPMPQAMQIPDAKAAVDKGWKKFETILALNLEKKRSTKEVPLCHVDGHMSPQECGSWNSNYRSTKPKPCSGETL